MELFLFTYISTLAMIKTIKEITQNNMINLNVSFIFLLFPFIVYKYNEFVCLILVDVGGSVEYGANQTFSNIITSNHEQSKSFTSNHIKSHQIMNNQRVSHQITSNHIKS